MDRIIINSNGVHTVKTAGEYTSVINIVDNPDDCIIEFGYLHESVFYPYKSNKNKITSGFVRLVHSNSDDLLCKVTKSNGNNLIMDVSNAI